MKKQPRFEEGEIVRVLRRGGERSWFLVTRTSGKRNPLVEGMHSDGVHETIYKEFVRSRLPAQLAGENRLAA